MKKEIYSMLALAIGMVSCSTDEAELFDAVGAADSALSQNVSRTVTYSDTLDTDTIVPMTMTHELRSLHEVVSKIKPRFRAMSTDEEMTFAYNKWAIIDLPVNITVRKVATSKSDSRRSSVRNPKSGKNMYLDKLIKNNKDHVYYLKHVAGVLGYDYEYLIYSKTSDTPLTIGLSGSTPLLMAQRNNDKLTDFVGWDLIPSPSNPGYFALSNTMYRGRSTPNDDSTIFSYTLEAMPNNELRFTKPVPGKAQQEFLITPVEGFTLESVDYDLNSAVAYGPYYMTKTLTRSNNSDKEVPIGFLFNINPVETSKFIQNKSTFYFPLENDSVPILYRPYINGGMVMLHDDAEGNEENRPKKDAIYKANFTHKVVRNNFLWHFSINGAPRTNYRLDAKFAYYQLKVKYKAHAYYGSGNDRRDIILTGTWEGTSYEDPQVITPIYDLTSSKIGGGDEGEVIPKL